MNSTSTNEILKTEAVPSRRRTIIGTIVLIVATIICVALLIAHGGTEKHPANILDDVQGKVRATYGNLAADQLEWPAQMGAGTALTVPGYNFNVSTQSLPSLYFTMKEGPGAGIVAKHKTAQSPHDVSHIVDEAAGKAKFIAYYDNANTITYIREDQTCLSLFAGSQNTTTLTCYTDQTVGAAASKLAPFVSAYTDGVKNIAPSSPVFGPVMIKSEGQSGVIRPSKTTGYDIAEMIVQQGDSKQLALFYNKNGGTWQYITQAHDEFGFSCAAFTANADVRAAMHDQICLGDHGQERLDTNNRALQ